MTSIKRKKNSRQRGSCTHGWGAMKKHRGKGNKGGSGMAGTGKRGDAKKPVIWKSKYFGKYNFKKKGIKKEVKPINLDELEKKLSKLLIEKKVNKEGDMFIINLPSIGYNKLLGKGRVSNKLKIIVDAASKKAIVKVQEKGGEIITKKEESE
ncbi:MAG: uL15 family ribosomal protein [Nanoarchaeota archaeon]|nr:uL15 family ribosomal protein [Thermodesulfovibrionia bacterium]MCK5282736.1 uL15 family ribosomal protein [Nanoarchaeota archaeon]